MPLLFDLHAESEHLALLKSDPRGGQWIELRTLDGRLLANIAAQFLPLSSQWSPDGSTLAFASNDGLLYLFALGEASPRVIYANPALQAGFCEWAADGNRLVFSAYDKIQNTPPSIYCLRLDTGQTYPLTDDVRTVDRFPHWAPSGRRLVFQRQFLDDPELPRRTYITEVQTGVCYPALDISDGDCDAGRFSWSPDSASLLVTLSHKHRVQARVIRLQDQSTMWSYESATLQGGVFSPHGDRILCICSDELLWFAYPEGTLLQRLSLASFSPVRFYFTNAQVGFDQHATRIYFLGTNLSLYRWKIGEACECIFAESPQVKPAFTHEAYFVPSRDGRSIPVQRFIPTKPMTPAILYVHGGPGGAIDPDDPFMLRLLAEGVEFVCVAYRGSSGYGPEHEEANREEYGRADVWDILAAGFDWKKRAGSDRPLVIVGYSYGGFLMFLAMAQEEIPWAGGIGMWSLSGMHRLGLHQQRAFPAEAGQLAAAKIERSPLEQARRIRVPLLIFHGALDTTATTEEMRSIQDSILSRGGECELIVFEDDTHGLMRHRDDIHARVLIFLGKFT